MLTWFAVLVAVTLVAVLVIRTPSAFLFDLIEGCFSHGLPPRER